MDKTLLIISILFVILFNVALISSKIDRTEEEKKRELSFTEHNVRMIILIIVILFFVAVTYFALSFF